MKLTEKVYFKLKSNILPIFYIVLLLIVYKLKGRLLNSDFSSQDLVWTAKYIPFIIKNEIYKYLFFLITLLFIILSIFFNKRIIRIICCFFVVTFFGFCFSHGKILHTYHAWIYSCIFIIFYNNKKLINSSNNFLTIRLIQSTLLLSYFSSGIWKLRNLFIDKANLSEIALRPIAQSIARHGPENRFVLFLLEIPDIIAIGFCITIIFQLSTFIPILLNRYFKMYGLLIILFHIMTGLTVNIWFKKTVYAIIFFFIFVEYFIAKEQKTSQIT
jgi:hypothetical protein